MVPVEFHAAFALATFLALVIALVLDLVDLAVGGMLAVAAVLAAGILEPHDLRSAAAEAGPTLSLLFGGMVLVRILTPTGLFDALGQGLVRASRGSGARLLVAFTLAAVPTCAFLPNATVILLFAPILLKACERMGLDPVPPLVFLVAVANSAGLLTLVGDPATFIVGSGIGMTFDAYLRGVSPFGFVAIGALLLASLVVLRGTWTARSAGPVAEEAVRLHRPAYIAAALAIFALQVLLFVWGDIEGISPPEAAFICAALGLLVIYGLRVESPGAVLVDVDWRTLIFIACMFMMVQALIHTGWLQGGSRLMASIFGDRTALAAIAMVWVVGLLSMVLPNVPVVIGLLLVVKGYLVQVEAVPEEALGANFSNWPAHLLPVFVGMMFGATLGGNGTVIGAAGNVVAAGIAAKAGHPIGFLRFLRIGLPLTLAQLVASTLCILWMLR
jgi:Na+/H+ antiporter NhaD/arsenite permease-like protein